jgi:putative DNA primase/helicase
MSIDFSGIRAANPIADVVGRYVELRRAGTEYRGLCPFHADKSPSLYVNPKKGKAFCMACHWAGDAIDFVAEYESCDLAEAARKLGHDELPKDRPAPAPLPPDTSDEWRPILPVPADAPAYDPAQTFNPKRGRFVRYRPVATWPYRDAAGDLLGYVLRLEIDGAKITPTITYCQHKDGTRRWCARPFPVQRPLYGLDKLAARPEAPVVVVEGEKAADAAQAALPRMVVVTWPGGTNGVRWADFSPIELRDVTFWPDADLVGIEAMLAIAAKVPLKRTRWINTDGLPKGFDAADVEGSIPAFCKERVTDVAPVVDRPAAEGSEPERGAQVADEPGGRGADDASPEPSAATEPPPAIEGEVVDLPRTPSGSAYAQLTSWSSLDLVLSDKGVPVANMDNAARLLERHPDMQGRFWFDEFQRRVYSTWNPAGTEQEWSDADDVRLALWMQRTMGIGRMAVGTARDAVTAVAMAHKRNEVHEWLRALEWDGVARLSRMLPEAFGTVDTPYTQAVGRCWLVSMVARALDPGCKVDTMPVFEGDQGLRKSTAMQTLVGARWFAEASESPTSKDFYQVLTGKLLVEIAELDAFSKAEVNTIKRVVTCRVDRYRAPYGRRAEDHPRACVFAGTTNRDDWNRDETGARRFWPVACTAVDVEWLARHRDQLFAEAVELYEAGSPWWDVPREDAEREQEARRASDEWEEVIADWTVGKWEVTVGDVLQHALGVAPEHWDKAMQMRAANCLRVLGWRRTTARRGSKVVKMWLRGGNGGNDAPF